MARYIDKDKVLNRLRYLCEVASEPPQDNDDVIEWALLQRLEKEFSKMPTADVEEVKHGRWLPQVVGGVNTWDCSECKTIGSPQWKRCPICEAKMDGCKEE